SVMSSSSTVTYTSVYTNSEPGRVFWGADEELSDGGSPRVIVYGYDGLPMQSVAPPSLDYVPGPEHPPSPDYVPGPEHPPSPVEVPYVPEVEYPEYYVADSDPDKDPEEDPKEDHAYYPADGGDSDDDPFDDDDDDDDTDDEDEDDDESPQTKVPFAQTRLRRARKTIRIDPPMSPSMEACIAEYAVAPIPPSPPPSPLSPWSPPLPQIPSPPLPPPPSSLHLPLPVPTSLPLQLSPLPPLPASLLIPPLVDRRENISEAELPHRHRADYGFIGTMDAEIRRQRAEEVGYDIREVWVDPTEAVEEVASTTLEGVNARVTKLATVQEQDTQDIYVVIKDTQDRQTQLFQRFDGLVEDRQFHYKTARLLDQEALIYREAWAHSVGLSSAVHYELQAYRTHTQMQDYHIALQELLMTKLIAQNNMPPRRSSATARAAAAARAVAAARAAAATTEAATSITVATVEQLIEARVSATLANHETLQNSTNGQGDGSHN
ncbi:hypothetical protein Tco_1469635, partial [Tanacetum coccineum]